LKVGRYTPGVDQATLLDLRERLGRTRWPTQPDGIGWDLGVDLGYLREVCDHWAEGYDFGRLERMPGAYENGLWKGIHFLRADGEGERKGVPVVILHAWPGGVVEFVKVIPLRRTRISTTRGGGRPRCCAD
jgi:epoxide hydrolase